MIPALCLLIFAACASRSAQLKPALAPNLQSELAELQIPQGADPQVFAQLKDELARQLAERGKVVSTPPTGAANAPANVHFTDEGGGNYALHWEYRNIGDYDQNSSVGVTDITPIAMHFGHAPGTDGLDVVIDVDNNGVGVSDITPIAQNFGVDIAHYVVESSDAENGDYTNWVMLPFGDGTGGTDGWKTFAATDAFDPARWYRVYPEDQFGARGQESAAIQIGGSAGNPPVINSVTPTSGETGTNVTFTVGYDGDEPMSFEWYFGGGATPNTSSDPSPTVTLGAVNMYSASVTLTNAVGSDVYNFNLNVIPAGDAWQYYRVVDAADTGSYISFAFIDGLPAFAYVNASDGTLHYVRSTVANPSSATDWVNMVVDEDPTNWYDGEISLIADNYLTPVILAWDATDNATMFVGSNVVTPDSAADWEVSVVAQPTDEAGALTLAQGTVFATYKDMGGLYFAEAVSYPPTGAADWSVITADPTMGAGSNSRMRYNEEDQRFYILSHNVSQSTPDLSHCLFDDRATPASWVTFNAHEGYSGDAGSYLDFDIDPAVGSDNLFLIYYVDQGTTGTPVAMVGFEGATDNSTFLDNGLEYSPGNYPGRFCSTAFGNQSVVVCYQDADPTVMKFMYAPYVEDEQPLGWVVVNLPEVSAYPLTDTNVLVYNGNIAEVVYGREDGVYFASLVMD